MRIGEIDCRTALSHSRLPGLRYALNPYRGCSHGCRYCYASAVLHETRPWGEFVDVKRNLPAVLAKELKRKAGGVVGVGTVTDAYQPVEETYRITRMSLRLLLRSSFPISIQTKSPLVLRDVDILCEFEDVNVGFTLTTLDDKWRLVFEPGAPPPQDRLAAMTELSSRGIRTWAFIGPLLPLVTEEDLQGLVQSIVDAGAHEVLVDRLNLKRDTWEKLEPALRGLGMRDSWHSIVRKDPGYFKRIETQVFNICKAKGINCLSAFRGP
ncbi:MAG: radical SAM protein [Thermoplasmata archaeon]